jgi:hypothetical protein
MGYQGRELPSEEGAQREARLGRALAAEHALDAGGAVEGGILAHRVLARLQHPPVPPVCAHEQGQLLAQRADEEDGGLALGLRGPKHHLFLKVPDLIPDPRLTQE